MKILSLRILAVLSCVRYGHAQPVDEFAYPTASGIVTCGFNALCAAPNHLGVDLRANSGDAVFAPAVGIVREARWHTRYGGTVIIEHDLDASERATSVIAHLRMTDIQVRAGDEVARGQRVGYVGTRTQNGGWSPHVHWGVRRGSYDARTYSCGTRQEWNYAGYTNCPSAVIPQWYDPAVLVESWSPDLDSDGWTVGEGDCLDEGETPEGIRAEDVHPGATEVCNYADDNCDGVTDEGFEGVLTPCTVGVGVCENSGTMVCTTAQDAIACSVLPRSPSEEICDGEDDDCDGVADDGVLNACGDCGVVPVETCNGEDDDCDGVADEGLGLTTCGFGVCLHTVANCVDGVVEVCDPLAGMTDESCNGEDDDCDGEVDEGVLNACGTCGAVPTETCNGEDDDCDGVADDGVLNACGDCGVVPVEICNGEDDDCDAAVDEDLLDCWRPSDTVGAPIARTLHTAVWTGSEMIVWGGTIALDAVDSLNTGGRYDLALNSWIATSIISAPSERDSHSAIWTGSEMIVWGGWRDADTLNTGGRYNPLTNSWTGTATGGAPSVRDQHTVVWTGSEMIVWGGWTGSASLNTGGRYDPSTNSWIGTSTVGTPSARFYSTAIWTGSEMIVWGGWTGSASLNTGGRYDPGSDAWATTTIADAPSARVRHTAVWTGSEMIVWGGLYGLSRLNTGGRYDPSTNSWTATATTGAPAARSSHTAIWTGSEMIVWGGWTGSASLNTGGRYDPSTNSWIGTSTVGAPSARDNHTAAWTASEMIVWGGFTDISVANTGGRYTPP